MIPIPNHNICNGTMYVLQNTDSLILSALNEGIIKTRIMEYIETNSQYLDLTNTALDFRSNDIFKLSIFRDHLYGLNLNQNQLITLPESIGNLQQLRFLGLYRNQLKTLPESIGNLSELKELYLSSNQLKTLPESIGNLLKLTTLDLSRNQLTLLPNSMENLSELQELSFYQNQLETIPESVGNLRKLQILNLNQNQLETIPESTGNLSELKELYLSSNQLRTIPEFIGNLLKLTTLDLSRNQLTLLPNSMENLSELQELSFWQNQLETIPESVGNLRKLQVLNLNNNQLTTIPESTCNLLELRHLYLSSNQLSTLSESIGNLQQLQFLDLSNNPNLSSLPDAIFNLPNTCTVELNGCNFSPDTLDGLRERIHHPDYRGPRIFHVMLNDNPNQVVEDMLTIEESLQKLYTIINKAPSKLLERNKTETLRIWLYRLFYTADYRQSQKEFITKIISYLEKANSDEGFREIFFTTIDDAVATCGDRIALSVLQLGINYQLEAIDLNNMKDLAQFLIKGVWVLEILHEIARKKVKDSPDVDAIEVYLGYPIQLKKQLDLPIDVTEMLYFNFSTITPSELETAEKIVLATINDQNELSNFLINQPKWTDSLKHNCKEEFLSIINRRENDGNSDDPDYMKIQDTYETELKALTMKVLSSLKIVVV